MRERKLEERGERKNAERGFAGGGFAKEEEESERWTPDGRFPGCSRRSREISLVCE